MYCPYCGAKLEHNDVYGSGRPKSTWVKTGDIYVCPNREGFDNIDDATMYLIKNNNTEESTEDVVCDSAMFDGFFYVVGNTNVLKEGYPC